MACAAWVSPAEMPFQNLYRLTGTDRAYGTANDQTWGLDAEGNFKTFNDGNTPQQTRTVNAANEITGLSGSWKDPVYDAAGNLISGPKVRTETTRVHYVYDAWNRLVAVKEDASGSPGNVIVAYKYDGLNRRRQKADSGSTQYVTHYYYNDRCQMLEERAMNGGPVSTSRTTSAAALA